MKIQNLLIACRNGEVCGGCFWFHGYENSSGLTGYCLRKAIYNMGIDTHICEKFEAKNE